MGGSDAVLQEQEDWTPLFVPGRVCLFGEHSDWAGEYRRVNPSVSRGATIVVGTNHGVHARVRRHPDSLIVRSCDFNGKVHSLTMPMDEKELLQTAREGGYFSYVAGVAYRLATDFHVSGLELDNYLTDLPMGKGLSSSAAICVLVARAFNTLYNLRLTTRGEMEYAYQGEIVTPSKCGRMDQACAFGRPVVMHYDADVLLVENMKFPKAPLHYLLVDLNSSKSTKEILASLREAFPHPRTDMHRGVQRLLGEINLHIVERAKEAFENGDGAELGRLMNEAQAYFFEYAQPACPAQLTMPVLRSVLTHAGVNDLVYGGKGVGSQGDGMGQLLCRSEEDQQRLAELLKAEFGMTSIPVTISDKKT